MSKKNTDSKMGYRLCLLLIVVSLMCINATITQATSVTTAEVEDCIVNEEGFICDKKVIVSTEVSYGIMSTIDAVVVTTIQKDGEPTPLEETIKIDIEKSRPSLIYPLTYLHTVPYFPYEEVIKVPDVLGCIDCADAVTPTAGWTYQGSTKIEHSQGFCVSKLLQSFNLDFLWRGEEILGEKATLDNPFSTAHAMRMGELMFDGYEVGEFLKYYEIDFTMRKGELKEVFTLTPNDPYYSVNQPGGGFQFRAELVGDKEGYKGVPNFDNYILYIPSSPATHPFVQDYQHNMLLVPREEISRDGTELDKVGVGFYAFRKLMGSNARVTEAGDGLGNQLFQKHNSDLAKLIMNPDAETNYLVHGQKDFKGSMEFKTGMKKQLEYSIDEINNSQVTIHMNLDSLKVVSTESLGIIVEAYAKAFDSMSNDGVVVAEIQNYGDMKTDYAITVTEISTNIIQAVPAQARILKPGEKATIHFDIHTVDNLDITNELLVSLRSPTGRLYDEILVKFDTFNYLKKYPWDLYEKNEASQEGDPEAVSADVTAPVIVLNSPDDAIVLWVGDVYNEPNAIATDNVDGIVPVIIGGDVVDTSTAGIYVVTYDTIDIAGNQAKQLTRTVIVRETETIDSDGPVIKLIGPDVIDLNIDAVYQELGAIAVDDVDGLVNVVIGGDVVDTSVAGIYTVAYDASDSSGNAAVKVTRTINVVGTANQDATAPRLLLLATPTMLWPANNRMVKVTVNSLAVDDTDPNPVVSLVGVTLSQGDEAKDIKILADGTIYLRAKTGGHKKADRVYTITYQAVDVSGNSTLSSATVTVPRNKGMHKK